MKIILFLFLILFPLSVQAKTTVIMKTTINLTNDKDAGQSGMVYAKRKATPISGQVNQRNVDKKSMSRYAKILDKQERIDTSLYFAEKYDIDPDTFLCTLTKESGINGWYEDTLKCGDNGLSCGIGQIQLPTWRSIRKHAGWSTEDLRGNDFENIKTTAYGISTLWRWHWTAYKLCTEKGIEFETFKK